MWGDQTVWGPQGSREEGWQCHVSPQEKVLGRTMTRSGPRYRRKPCTSSAGNGLGRDERHRRAETGVEEREEQRGSQGKLRRSTLQGPKEMGCGNVEGRASWWCPGPWVGGVMDTSHCPLSVQSPPPLTTEPHFVQGWPQSQPKAHEQPE